MLDDIRFGWFLLLVSAVVLFFMIGFAALPIAGLLVGAAYLTAGLITDRNAATTGERAEPADDGPGWAARLTARVRRERSEASPDVEGDVA